MSKRAEIYWVERRAMQLNAKALLLHYPDWFRSQVQCISLAPNVQESLWFIRSIEHLQSLFVSPSCSWLSFWMFSEGQGIIIQCYIYLRPKLMALELSTNLLIEGNLTKGAKKLSGNDKGRFYLIIPIRGWQLFG